VSASVEAPGSLCAPCFCPLVPLALHQREDQRLRAPTLSPDGYRDSGERGASAERSLPNSEGASTRLGGGGQQLAWLGGDASPRDLPGFCPDSKRSALWRKLPFDRVGSRHGLVLQDPGVLQILGDKRVHPQPLVLLHMRQFMCP